MIVRQGLRVFYYGVILMIVGEVGTIFVVQALGTGLQNPLPLVPFIFVVGVGQGAIATPLINLILTNIAPRHAGAASGAVTTANQVSQALGVALVGVVFFSILGVPGKTVAQLSAHYDHAFMIAMIAIVGTSILTFITLIMLAHTPQKPREEIVVAGEELVDEMPMPLVGMH
jgi:MFS family permease